MSEIRFNGVSVSLLPPMREINKVAADLLNIKRYSGQHNGKKTSECRVSP